MGILRSFIESRAHPKNPDAFWINGVSGRETMSGIRVDEDEALSATAIWNGVRVICDAVASVPLNLMETEGKRRDVAAEHPVQRVLQDPNPELTRVEFAEMQQANVLLGGDCYAEIVTDGAGFPAELWPIWPHRIQPMRLRPDAPIVYAVETPGGEKRYLPMESVLHVRGFSLGGLCGTRVVDTHRESLGLTLALERYGASFYGNGSQPGGILEHPRQMSPEAQKNFKASWEGAQRGLDKAHRVAILEEGMTWKQMGVSPEQAQAIESRKFQVTEAARILNIPPHMIKDMEHATFSNIEHQFIEFFVITMTPWYMRWEQRYNKQLLLPSERGRFYTKHNVEARLRGDIASRYAAYAVGRNWGWLTINDILELEDRNPITEPYGDERLVPLNMIPADQAGAMPEPDAPLPIADVVDDRTSRLRGRLERAQRGMFEDVASRVLVGSGTGGEIGAIRAALKKDAVTFRVWVDSFYEKHGGFVARAFLPALKSYAETVSGAVADADDLSPAVVGEVERFAAALGERWAADSLAALRAVLKDAEDHEAGVGALLERWAAERPGAVSADEVARAGSEFARTALAA